MARAIRSGIQQWMGSAHMHTRIKSGDGGRAEANPIRGTDIGKEA